MKNVLCYGDSNTWGACPFTGRRLGKGSRWPGILQELLGDQFEVIEAGLCGRTTVWDDPFDAYRNGRDMLVPTMRQAQLLDLLVIMLGTNDLKTHSAWQASMGMEALVHLAKAQTDTFRKGVANILVVSPVAVEEPYFATMADPSSLCTHEESLKFGAYYEQIARGAQVAFFHAAQVAGPKPQPQGDGIHLDKAGHTALAKALAPVVARLTEKTKKD